MTLLPSARWKLSATMSALLHAGFSRRMIVDSNENPRASESTKDKGRKAKLPSATLISL